ncbi:bifunctional hydroxymethylpyrimidine kinase/phosphomethylpyrimidine kinase [Luteolibacter flavescens]|uniref:hydroxymethylpyrimidine kinase n=1 Tax=Luteolibacter flavescens TaxID=1859460 RepID=A0ABT3FLQ2_9BACT|nr:bifunctional hydroxymethylpyrimidine kinase/phosphomethylpyrimidine kinase [Luteolibacter flavescens]MCW1884279.1 bifunctional hydroxymethylpyrimidine kinase/phosphomethylpyrimidine kinase [Luteolibacter flavescens]
MNASPPVALTIAGSDCSAGAGLQADLKTFQHFGIFGLTAVTCVVAETPKVVRSVHAVPPAILQDQLRVMLDAFPVAAIKTGMLFSKAHIVAVTEILQQYPGIPLVIDPVMIASTGDPLLEENAISAYKERLFPLATVITPNLDEAEVLWGSPARDEATMERAARELSARHGCAVLLKGGHLGGPECADLLMEKDLPTWFRSPRIATPASHGTGCTLSAAIAASLALGKDLHEAIAEAKGYLEATLHTSFGWGDLAVLNQGTLPLP